MPELSRQRREERLDVQVVAVPAEHGGDSEAVSRVCSLGRRALDPGGGASPASSTSHAKLRSRAAWESRVPRHERKKAALAACGK